jgi:hypothetical protein
MSFLEAVGMKNMLSFHTAFYDILAGTCSRVNILCRIVMNFFIEDYPTNRMVYEELFKDFMYAPSGSSTRNVNHWIQMFETKQFGYFDHGKEINIAKYGQEKPPAYDLGQLKGYRIKSFVTVSDADPYSKKEDCEHLFGQISEDVVTIRELNKYNHLDYLWSYDARDDLYYDIINFLKEDFDLA